MGEEKHTQGDPSTHQENKDGPLPAVTSPPQGYACPPGGAPGQQGYYYNAQGQVVQGQFGVPPQVGYQPPPVGGVPYIPPQPGVPGAPVQIQMMVRPPPIPGVPSGLEYLSQIDQLLVHQQIEVFEMLTNWETKNRYMIKNSIGQQVYFAQEESDGCQRQCCGPSRGFIMHITDNLGQEVMRVTREFKCCAGYNCCACSGGGCAMEIQIEAPVGHVIGSVKQECSFCAPTYGVFDSEGRRVLGVLGPVCFCQAVCCPNDIDFKVSSESGEEVGKISKQWGGYMREAFTTADNFGVTFPVDLDVRIKAVLLGAVFLIDFMYFEQKQNNNY